MFQVCYVYVLKDVFFLTSLFWVRSGSDPGQSFSLSLSGPISINRANAHMVYMGRK